MVLRPALERAHTSAVLKPRSPEIRHELLLTTLARKAATLSAHISSWVESELRSLVREEARLAREEPRSPEITRVPDGCPRLHESTRECPRVPGRIARVPGMRGAGSFPSLHGALL